MAFPAPLQTVKVTLGPVLNVAGSPVEGELVALRLSDPVRIVGSGSFLPSVAVAYTGADGVAELEVVATNSVGISRTDWTYHLTSSALSGAIALPAAVPSVRVEDLLPVPASSGNTVWLPADLAAILANAGTPTTPTPAAPITTGTAAPTASTPGNFYVQTKGSN
jgi:hypothetical protein